MRAKLLLPCQTPIWKNLSIGLVERIPSEAPCSLSCGMPLNTWGKPLSTRVPWASLLLGLRTRKKRRNRKRKNHNNKCRGDVPADGPCHRETTSSVFHQTGMADLAPCAASSEVLNSRQGGHYCILYFLERL